MVEDEYTNGEVNSERSVDTVQDTDQSDKPKPTIPSRGIPSKEAMYLPPHYSKELRRFQDDNETPTRNYWSLEEVVNFIFPKKYQEKYYEIALSFLKLVVKVESSGKSVTGDDIGRFIKENNISKATFYNRVLPRLKRVGMIKVERETIVPLESKRKFRPMKISLSKTFGNYLNKIGDSWLAIVDDVRSRR